MPRPSSPLALAPLPCTSFINFILRHHTSPTTLIICSTRESFLQELHATINHTHPTDSTANPSGSPASETNHATSLHPLLVPTIHLIARSQSVTLAFAPTLPHLRAYIATYTTDVASTSVSSTSTKPGSQYPILAIWGLANLHRSTAEHSAQGLARTLATAVETAKLNGQRLVLAESRGLDEEGEYESGGSGGDPWKEQVPLLSGSVRLEREHSVWDGRTVEVRRVVRKWCRFVMVKDEA